TLLASSSLAGRHGYKLDTDREVLTYALGNIAAAFTGCCPVNGSVSRSSMGEQYGGSSQVMSITASVTMAGILLFATGFIQYLPVPVLTAIVISALLGAVEFHLIKRLYQQDRKELVIFFAAFFGVLLFGTVYGVLIGVTLSFVSIIIRTANPKRSYLGVIPGHEGFHSLERNKTAQPVKGAVIYRFSGNLYFANINIFVSEIESAVKEDTKTVVVDSGAICNLDITAADRIAQLQKHLAAKGISLYFASHIDSLNDRLCQLGLGDMVEQGRCHKTVLSAMQDAGFEPPYEPEQRSGL
ncbi:MAG: SulP family inorganic anion transporter, partial [Ruminococcus sp.]|nr:SulP family inorganic anion transporter [Ruminococcus sp.]